MTKKKESSFKILGNGVEKYNKEMTYNELCAFKKRYGIKSGAFNVHRIDTTKYFYTNEEIEFLKNERLTKMEAEMKIKQKEAEQRINLAQENAMKEIVEMTSDVTIKAIKEVLLQKLDKSTQAKLIDESIVAISEIK